MGGEHRKQEMLSDQREIEKNWNVEHFRGCISLSILKSCSHTQFGIVVQISNVTVRPFVENRFYVSTLYLSDDILY